jgi:hypothetical protein
MIALLAIGVVIAAIWWVWRIESRLIEEARWRLWFLQIIEKQAEHQGLIDDH